MICQYLQIFLTFFFMMKDNIILSFEILAFTFRNRFVKCDDSTNKKHYILKCHFQ